VANYLAYLERLVQDHARDYYLDFQPRVDVTPELLRNDGFDVVVVCTGARPAVRVCQAWSGPMSSRPSTCFAALHWPHRPSTWW